MKAQDKERRKPSQDLARRAARSALMQHHRGIRGEVRELYYEAHSLLRAVRHHLWGDHAA